MKKSDDLKVRGLGWTAAQLAGFVLIVGLASGVTAQVPTGSTQFDLNQYRPAELATDGFATSTADGQVHPYIHRE